MAVTLEEFTSKEGLKVKVTYPYFYGGLSSRTGILEIDEDWAYVYDEGKTGADYNGAYHLTDDRLKEIISIELIIDLGK